MLWVKLYKLEEVLQYAVGKEANTISEIGAREGISPKLLGNWKREFLDNAYRAFSVTKDEKAARTQTREALEREQELLAKIGGLTYELDWLKKKVGSVDSRTKAGVIR